MDSASSREDGSENLKFSLRMDESAIKEKIKNFGEIIHK